MLNELICMGWLTADPELKQTPSGIMTTSFTVAIDRDYVRQGQERQADFIGVVAWRNTAEFICRNFSKGQMIALKGSIRTRSYQDKRYADVKHYVTELYADQVYFCGSKPQQAAPPTTSGQANIDTSDFEDISAAEELPF